MSTAKPASTPAPKPAAKPVTTRIASLDQFRGYTVAGMFLVNFVGYFACTHILLKHSNTFCSYADTIMPQFFFAVGFAFRLTFGRREQAQGLASAYWHMVRRMLGLVLVAIVIYGAPKAAADWEKLLDRGFWDPLWIAIKGTWFQTLTHIAVTSLWILPVIRSGPLVRTLYMIFSAAMQVGVSYWFYFDWVHTGCVDGGPLGFLAWTIPTIVGTLACDLVSRPGSWGKVVTMMFCSLLLMGLGWGMSCLTTLYNVTPEEAPAVAERVNAKQPRADDAVLPTTERRATHELTWAEPPFVPPPSPLERQENYWMMSQRAATLSYHTFAAGFSLAVYAIFYLVCDIWGFQLGMFRTLGTNALVGYILHGIVDHTVKAFAPKDAPVWYVACAFLLYFGITYLFIRHLEKNKIYLKL